MKGIVTGLIPALVVVQPVAAQSRPAPAHYQIHIERQSVGSALREFALQTNIQIAHLSDVDVGVEVREEIRGSFTAEEALIRILAGTSLRYEFVNERMIAILSMPAGTPGKPPTTNVNDRNGEPGMMRNTGFLSKLAGLFSVCALAVHPGSACAQDASPAGADSRAAGAALVIQEIVVTATRREETVNRVPLSITALDTRALDDLGVVNVDELARLTPGVTFARTGYADTTNISIRGIGSDVGTATTGIYIDDVPVQVRSLGFAATNLYPANFDFERVEVLRGPQGTLFGAGSEGGTVRFITVQPGLSEYSGYARADFGFTADGGTNREIGVAFGGPIVEQKLGFRVSAWGRHDGGYIDRVSPLDGTLLQSNANSQNEFATRVAVTWAPSDVFKATLMGYYQDVKKRGGDGYFDRISLPGEGIFRAADPLGSPTRDKYFDGALTLQAKLGDLFTLTSVTSDLWREDVPVQDYSHFMPTLLFGPSLWDSSLTLPLLPGYTIASQFVNKQNNLTEEIRLQTANQDARLSATLGFFFTNSRQRSTQTLLDPMLGDLTQSFFGGTVEQIFGVPMLSPTVSYISDDRGVDKQKAVFGEVSYEILRGLRATAGVRWSKADFSYTNHQAGPWAGTLGAGSAGSESEKPVTPKFGVSYQADDRNMYYATIAKGFRIGGANRPIPITSAACEADLAAQGLQNAPPSYSSDHVWSYEIGAKNGLADGRVQVNSSLYYIKWANIQQSVYLSNCGFNYVGNLGSAISKGGDVQIQALVSKNLSLGVSLAYTNAYYNQTVLGGISAGGGRSILVNDGNALPHSPWSAILTGEYRFKLPDDVNSFVRLTYSYDSHLGRALPTQDPATQGYDPDSINAPTTNLLDLRAGAIFGSAEVSIYANNLFNNHPTLFQSHDILGSRLFYRTSMVRTIGLRATYRF